MTRYLRLYLHFLRFSFSRAMEFRFDFGFRIVMDVVWYLNNLALYGVLYRHTSLLGGWNEDQSLVFLGTLFLADALNMTIFANNMWWFPIFVNQGDLDYYLVRPVSSLFFLSFRDFAANSFVNLLMTFGFMAWALARYPGELGAVNLAIWAVMLAGGVILHWLVELCFLIPVFWLHQGTGLRDIAWSLNRYSQYPDGIYTGWMRRIVVSLLPFALMASFPCRALFSSDPWPVLLHTTVVVAGFSIFVAWLWDRGLRSYSSASS